MRKKIIYLCFLLVGLLIHNFSLYPAAAASEKPQFAQEQNSLSVNPLLIFLDSSEKNIGGVSRGLLRALESEAAPIITTEYLLKHVNLSLKDLELMNQPEWDDEVAAFNKLDGRKKQQISHPTKLELLMDIFIFEKKELIENRLLNTNPGDDFFNERAVLPFAYPFLIKQISDDLYLLLPKKYLSAQQKQLDRTILDAAKKDDALPETITALEYILGLRINHMKNSTLEEILNKKIDAKKPVFIDFFDTLFVKKADYLKNSLYKENEYSIPQQALFFMGHGGYDTSVSGLSLKDFNLFLKKLRLIPMRLYIYFSCYASGKNQQSIFREEKLVAQNKKIIKDLVFDFSIMNFTIGDDAIATTSGFDFKKFAREAAKESPDFFELAQAFPSEGTPQIRKAGLSWFSFLDVKHKALSDKKIEEALSRQESPLKERSLLPKFISQRDPASVVEITETMVKTRTKDLVIKSPPVKNVLFSEQYTSPFRIPFKMILASDGSPALPLFRSLMPGNANHYLVGIESKKNTVTDIARSFLGDNLRGSKIYFIESIKAPLTEKMRELLELEKADQITFTDVTIYTSIKKAFFKFNSAWYAIPLTGEESLASKEESALLEKNESYFKIISKTAKIPFFASEQDKSGYEKFIDKAHILNIELFLGDREKKLESLRLIFKTIDFTDQKELYLSALGKLESLNLSAEEIKSFIIINPSAQALQQILIQEKATQEKPAQLVPQTSASSWYSFENLGKKAAFALGVLAVGYQLLKPEKKSKEESASAAKNG